MRVVYRDFNPAVFSFHKDPVLVLEEVWTDQELAQFQQAMQQATWKALAEMPAVAKAFPQCGNWLKADIAQQEADLLLKKIALPCIAEYIESFPGIISRHLNFNYYSYGAGDCLSTHDDTDEAYAREQGKRPPRRRLALVTYLHSRWEPDWGGELIIYETKKDATGTVTLEITHCIAPQPGSVAIFTVPRFHRVCRVDALAGSHRRLSIAGWFMTEHA
ncbi:MAG: hypothetical protein D6704_03590 [Nitrospirae bacterium]|nr:MAG: hypothetical protein D6704_03590 [Nitrospirota bacterium]